jgi:ribosomal protein S18 acetylase RimI-like enzyme
MLQKKPKIKIRAMRKADVPITYAMMQELAGFFGDKAKAKKTDLIKHCFGKNNMTSVLLAFADKKPVGFSLSRDWMNFTRGYKVRHVDFLYVREKFRGLGIGAALIQTEKDNASHQNVGRIDIGVSKKNKAAVNLYDAAGFKTRAMDSQHLRLYHYL